VVFSVTSIGKPTGEAYVEFISEVDQQEAMKKHKQHIGTRYIEIFKSTKADLLQALQQNRFYKEQAQKRQFLNQTMMGIHPQSSMVTPSSHRSSLGSYDFQEEDVSDMLKGLRVTGGGTTGHPGRMILSPGALQYQTPSYGTGPNFQPPTGGRQTHFPDPRYFVPDQIPAGRAGASLEGNLYSRMGVGMTKGVEGGTPQGMIPRHEVIMGHQNPYLVRTPPQHVLQQPHLMFGYRNHSPWISSNDIGRHGSLTQPPINPMQHQFTPSQYSGVGSTNVLQTSSTGMHPRPSYYTTGAYQGGDTSSNPSLSPAATFPDALEREDSLDLVGKSSTPGHTPGDQI